MQYSIFKLSFRTLGILLIESFLMICYLYFSAYGLKNILHSPIMFLLYPVLMLVLVFIASAIAYFLLAKRKNYSSLLKLCINSSFLVFLFILSYNFYIQWRFNKTHGYNAENQMLINMAYDNQHPFIGCAFSALQSEFASPRELNLQSYVAKDTNLTSNAVSNKAQIVYFVYGFTSESNREYFSKIIVTNSTPDLVFFNKKVSDDPEYDYVRILKKQNETVKGYKTFMKFDK